MIKLYWAKKLLVRSSLRFSTITLADKRIVQTESLTEFDGLFLKISSWFQLEPGHLMVYHRKADDRFVLRAQNTKRIGKKSEINDVWKKLMSVARYNQVLSDCLYIHSSPGMGKTFLLREIMRNDKIDTASICPDFVSKTMFLAMDFDGNSCTSLKPLKEKLKRLNSETLPLLRLFYLQFTTAEVDLWPYLVFRYVSLASHERRLELEINTTLKALFKIKAKILGHEHLVILVDEIAKTSIIDENFPNRLRTAICSWSDNGYDTPFVLTSIFATADRSLILKERFSRRRGFEAVTTLQLFSQNEAVDYLEQNLKRELKIISERIEDRKSIIRKLASVSGGYPSALEKLVYVCNSQLGPFSPVEAIKEAGQMLSTQYVDESSYGIIKLALLGNSVLLKETIPGTGESIESLISRGLLLNSLSHDTEAIRPLIPEFFLYMWSLPVTSRNVAVEHKEERSFLYELLMTCRGFTSKKWESFHTHYEILMRYLRPDHYESVQLAQLYGVDDYFIFPYLESGERSPNYSPIMRFKVDGKSKLSHCHYEKGDRIQLVPNTLHIPMDKLNPGWDSLIVYEVKSLPHNLGSLPTTNDKWIIPVFFVDNLCKDSVSAVYNLSNVTACVKACESFLQDQTYCSSGYSLLPVTNRNQNLSILNENFVVVFITGSDDTCKLKAECPPNVIHLAKDDIKNLYGPTLGNVIDTLTS